MDAFLKIAQSKADSCPKVATKDPASSMIPAK